VDSRFHDTDFLLEFDVTLLREDERFAFSMLDERAVDFFFSTLEEREIDFFVSMTGGTSGSITGDACSFVW